MTVRLLLFGSPTIVEDGKSTALAFERRTQLIVYLALKRGWIGRAELAMLLWPEQQSKSAFANLRKTLFRLQALNWVPPIDVQDAALRFEIDTDVHAFEAAVREQRLAEALALCSGELLAGFDDDANESWSNWLGFERDRLRAAWRSIALQRLAADIDAAEGIALAAQLLEADPLDEAALRGQMTWLAHSGQSARARQVYRDFADRIARELGLPPAAELKALHDSLGAAVVAPVPVATPTVRAADAGFIGRAVELRTLTDWLANDDERLVCIVGQGGAGKTRLARRAAEHLAPRFADGAAFVALEEVASTADLGGCIAREIGITPGGNQAPLVQVTDLLRERHMLLVLDNFEHLAAAAPVLMRLLDQCARLRILVTSRVRLPVAAQRVLPLEGLPCPEMEDLDRIEAFDAARLFIHAARRADPALDPAVEAASIADICRQVEGLPLALEMAAAWTRVLPCEVIAAELHQGAELLLVRDPTLPPRHASIEAVFDQSWQLLAAAEREALARLSVFRGGFTVTAARAVAAASLPVLGALSDKSLLRRDGERLFMHPLLHHLAALRLGEGAARVAVERAHARHFHRLLAQSRRAVDDGDRQALQAVETEFDNCRAAWRWSAATGDADGLAGSTLTLLHYCDHRGRREEGLALLREALASPAADGDSRLGALLLSAAAHLEYLLDHYAEAEATAARALAAAQPIDDDEARLQSLKVLGSCCLRLNRLDDARRYYAQALQRAPDGADPHNVAAIAGNLALVEKALGCHTEALKLTIQAHAQYRRLGDVAGEALCLNQIANLHLDKKDHATAGTYLREGLAVCDRHGLVGTRGFILANLTEVALRTGDLDAAHEYARRALEIAETIGNRANVCWLKLQLANLAMRRGDLDAARSALAASLAMAVSVGRPSLQLAGVVCFAELLAAQRDAECARGVLAFAAELPWASVPERDDINERLAQWAADARTVPSWPGLSFDELIHRIVIEAGIAHASLIAALRGTP